MKDSDGLETLRLEMERHFAAPFPDSVEKGETYGLVDAVMVGADLYGWSLTIARGGHLGHDDMDRFRKLRDQLAQSIEAFPMEARAYYEQLVTMASIALSHAP